MSAGTHARECHLHLVPSATTPLALRLRLWVMMFLEYFIWGAWLPLVADYLTTLGFTGTEKAWSLNAFAIASLTAMFFSTPFVDRKAAAEKFMATSLAIGGMAIFSLHWVTSFWPFFLLMLLHAVFYVPTMSIANSLAFAHLRDPQREFGAVRLWGTVGWIAASLPFVFFMVDWTRVPDIAATRWIDWLGAAFNPANSKTGLLYTSGVSYTFIAAGIAALLLAALSLTLPHTPPPKDQSEQRPAVFRAFGLLKQPWMLALFAVTLIDATVHQGYFVLTGSYLKNAVGIPTQWLMPALSLGQVAEIATMALLGTMLKRLGWKKTMAFGIAGHLLRFTVFAFFPSPVPVLLVTLLHGICYAFFFATVYIFVDAACPKDAKSSAQGLFNLLILGVGPFLGNFIWPLWESRLTVAGQVNYQQLFLLPAAAAGAAVLLLLLAFRPPVRVGSDQEEQADRRDPEFRQATDGAPIHTLALASLRTDNQS